MLNDNIEELQRIQEERDHKIARDMDHRDEVLRQHVSIQLNSFQENMKQLLKDLNQNRSTVPDSVSVDRFEGNGTADEGTTFTKQWESAKSAANNYNRRNQPHFASPPPSMDDGFGATSPTGNFRGRNVNLQSVREEGSNDGRSSHSLRGSPILGRNRLTSPDLQSPPIGFRPSSFGFEPVNQQAKTLATPSASQFKDTFIGTSPLADPKRGNLYRLYMGGITGVEDVDDLTLEHLENLGFVGEEINRIITRGIQQILRRKEMPDVAPKYYANFNKLKDLEVETITDFYSHLVIRLKRYGVYLLDFDALLPRWMHVGLTFPGAGELNYLQMSETLFNLLEKLLPLDEPIVKQIHTSLLGMNHDGFLFLRNVLAKCVPVFCPYKDSKAPTWRKTPDVAHIAKLWKLHFKLSRKTGSIYTPTQQSLMFLQSLKDPSLSSNATSIRGQIQLFTESIDAFEECEVHLPSNLIIDGITTTLTAFPSPIEIFHLFCYGKSIHCFRLGQ